MIQSAENNLPEGWALVSASDVCEVNPRKDAADALPADALVTFAPMAAVDENLGAITAPEDRPFGELRPKSYTPFAEGDVLLAKITPCMENGKAAVARGLTNGMGFGTTEFHVFRSTGAVVPEYLYHYIRQQSFRDDARAHMAGAVGQLRVPADYVKQFSLPLPPLAEQERIVAKVEALLTRVRSVRRRLDAVPGILKRFRQAVLTHACSGKLTEDWRDANESESVWRTTRLGELGDVKGGITKNAQRKSLPLQVPYLRVANVYSNKVDLSEVKEIGVTPAEFERTVLNPDNLLFVEGNGSVDQIGRVALWNGAISECVHQNHLIRFVAGDGILPRFVLYTMMSPIGRERLMANAISTAGLHSLSISKIAAVELDVPPLLEQHEIVRRVEALFTLADSIEQRVAAATKRAEALTQSILARAFRGELVPTEADLAAAEGREYETADQLVARIREESPTTVGVKRKGKRRRTRAETQAIRRGEAILAILLLLESWKKPVHRRWLDAGVILVLNVDVRAALLEKSTSKRRGRRFASEVNYQPALDIILNNLADADVVAITLAGDRQLIGLSAGFDRARLERATDSDRSAACEAIEVLEKLNERDAMSILQEMSRDVELELVS